MALDLELVRLCLGGRRRQQRQRERDKSDELRCPELHRGFSATFGTLGGVEVSRGDSQKKRSAFSFSV